MHVFGSAPSTAQTNVEPGSLELKTNLALRLVDVRFGPLSIFVSGGVVSSGVTTGNSREKRLTASATPAVA